MSQPPAPSAQVTAAEISRIAGVTRATVSNWRRRHGSFPSPSGGTDSSPLYDLEEVRAWLASRGQHTAATPSAELRTTLRLREPAGGGGTSDLLLLVLAAARRPADDLTALLALPDAELVQQANDAAGGVADVVPGAAAGGEPPRFAAASDAATLRALVHCVRDEGAQAALGVLAERELEDSAATGAYRTPAPLADLLARLVAGAARVLDPACGSGTLLEAAAARGARELFGQDSLPVQARRTAVGLLLTAGEAGADVTVRTGDSLRADAFPELTVDAVLCNPPYGDRDWGHDELAYDPRWAYGFPPRAESELAWVQHALAHLEPGGHAVLLLPPATASRASGRRVRAELVRGGALRAVAALPPGAAIPLHIGLQVWILQRPEPTRPADMTVLFVDTAADPASSAVGGETRSGSGAVDWPRVTEQIVSAWTAYAADPDDFEAQAGVARAVSVVDLLDEVVDVTPARHVRASQADVDPQQLAGETAKAREELAAAARTVAELASGATPWDAAGAAAREWRTATVSDLARGGALKVLRAVPASPSGSGKETEGTESPVPRPTLTGPDIARGTGPTGQAPDAQQAVEQPPEIAAGDVLVRNLVAGSGPVARVAGEAEAGVLLGAGVHLFRPDPARLDPWFLFGFLSAEANLAGASTGSSALHLSPGRLRVPLLPLAEQRRYATAFRHIEELREQARRTQDLAEETARLVRGGLTGGQLVPPPGTLEGKRKRS